MLRFKIIKQEMGYIIIRNIKIVTDSTTDLPSDVLENHAINVVPLAIQIDDKSYVDTVDITPTEFLGAMSEAKDLPKTSQPAVGELIERFEQLGKDGSQILAIFMTSGMSGTYDAAYLAAKETHADVTVIDSTYISAALGFQVVEAAKMADNGAAMEDILKRIETIRKNSRLYVVVETLDNLVKGGRIGKGKALIGSLLKLKPIAILEDGVYTPVSKVRTQTQVINTLMKYFKADTQDRKIKGVSISHANALNLARKLRESLANDSQFKDISIQATTPVISTHTGEGAIGLSYYTDPF